MEQRSWEIYTLTDPRTAMVRYVGVTFRGKRRINEHLSRAARGGRTHRDCWIRSLISVSIRPVYRVIERGIGDGWQQAERKWIALYRDQNDLTNLTDGGDGIIGYVPTPELRERWSKMRAGAKYPPGRRSAMLGRKHTPEAREKIRAAGIGRVKSEAARAKISAARKGKPLSLEHRRLLSVAKRGRVLSSDWKQKIAAATTTRKPVLCVETGHIFASITEAARSLGVSEASVNQAIRKGCHCRGNHLQFA